MKTRKKAAVEQRNGRWYAETTDSGCFGPFADKAEALAVLHPRRALWVFGLFWGAVLVLVTLLSLSAFGQTVANPTSGTVVPVSMSNIAPRLRRHHVRARWPQVWRSSDNGGTDPRFRSKFTSLTFRLRTADTQSRLSRISPCASRESARSRTATPP